MLSRLPRFLFLGLASTLLVSGASAGQLDAVWNAPTTNIDGSALTDLGGFRVYYAVDPAPCPGSATSLSVAATSPAPQVGDQATVHLSGLTAGLRYYVGITAVDLAGNESACSPILSAVARSDVAVPPDPGTPNIVLQSTGSNGAQFAVKWGASTGATSYKWSTGFNDGSWSLSGSTNLTSSTLTVPYHVSGAQASAFFCVCASANGVLSADQSCNGFTVPAAPITPPQTFTLTVVKAGTGMGTVTGAGSYNAGTIATPTATANASSYFSGWSGACTGPSACSVTMSANQTVTATFTMKTYTLTTTTVGSGTIAASPLPVGGMYAYGTAVTLTATPAAGFQFTGWSGACTGTAACNLTMIANQAATATFTAIQPQADTTPPSIAILSVNVLSGRTSAALTGKASDNVGVVRVTWKTSRGDSGTADGTTAWTATVPTHKQTTITVTAFDAAGNSKSAQVSVKGH
jgi:hypothetical protein